MYLYKKKDVVLRDYAIVSFTCPPIRNIILILQQNSYAYEQFSKGRSKNVTEGVNFKL